MRIDSSIPRLYICWFACCNFGDANNFFQKSKLECVLFGMHVCQIRNICFEFSQFEREMFVKSFKIYCVSRFVYNPLDKIKQPVY